MIITSVHMAFSFQALYCNLGPRLKGEKNMLEIDFL